MTPQPTRPTTAERDANIARHANDAATAVLMYLGPANRWGLTPEQFDAEHVALRDVIAQQLHKTDFRVLAAELPADDPARVVERAPRIIPAVTSF